MTHEIGQEKKHIIHHESLRPGRQRRHQTRHLSPCRCFYLPCLFFLVDSAHPSISHTDPAFLAVSLRFIFTLFIHHSLTLSFQSGLNPIFLSSTSPSHTSPIWRPVCPWWTLHTRNTVFSVYLCVCPHIYSVLSTNVLILEKRAMDMEWPHSTTSNDSLRVKP